MALVTLCMIVKNEEAVLERCLKSFAPVADEIVIVDTGSTDRTKEIAAAYTDKIYDFAWVDDFSAARNFAFSKCTKEYIYSADADEVLDDENRERFLLLKENLLPEIEIVQMWYINRHDFRTTENFERDLRPKLYRRERHFTWIEPVHETVRLEPVVFDSDIEILHMPVSAHQGRDFGIFKKLSAGEEGMSGKLRHMYAKELLLSGSAEDFADAALFFKKEFYETAMDTSEKSEVCAVLTHHYRLAGDKDEFFKWALKNISMSPCSEVCMELGNFYFDKGDVDEAAVWYVNAAEETEPVLKAQARSDAYEMLSHVYEKTAGLHPEIKDQALEMAVQYKMKAKEVTYKS
ncbi:MAG: glycosyltransferase family 2 protein [Lachnospiraceae bacterium]|nr:glycosyltransferase family 2 protein [Lachnospiraceae bacterium]